MSALLALIIDAFTDSGGSNASTQMIDNTMTTRTEQNDADSKKFIDQYGATWALIMADSKEAKIFARLADWQETYTDDAAKVFVRK